MANPAAFLSTLGLAEDVDPLLFRLIAYIFTYSTAQRPLKARKLMALVGGRKEFLSRLDVLRNVLRNRFGIILSSMDGRKQYLAYPEVPNIPLEEMTPSERPARTLLHYVLHYLFVRAEKVLAQELYDALYMMGINVNEEHDFFGSGICQAVEETFVEVQYVKLEQVYVEGIEAPFNYLSWGQRAEFQYTYDIVVQYDHLTINKQLAELGIENEEPLDK